MKFTAQELDFINRYEVCRFATSMGDKPHVVPVCYIFDDGYFYIAVDYQTKKYHNLAKNEKISLVVDTYKPNKAVMIEGEAEIIESGPEFKRMYEKFHAKFSWVRADPWEEGGATFIRVRPLRKVSWGL